MVVVFRMLPQTTHYYELSIHLQTDFYLLQLW
jgi:hypothetical protein